MCCCCLWVTRCLLLSDEKRSARARSLASYLLDSILNLGPTFIKVGQLCSTRSDLFPAEVSIEQVSTEWENYACWRACSIKCGLRGSQSGVRVQASCMCLHSTCGPPLAHNQCCRLHGRRKIQATCMATVCRPVLPATSTHNA